jgi:hypothetical protein
LLSQQQKQHQTMQQQQYSIPSLVMLLLNSSHSFQGFQGPGHSFCGDYSRQLAAVQGGTVCTVSRPAGFCQMAIWLVLMMRCITLQRQQVAAAAGLLLLLLLLLLRGMRLRLLVLRCV